MMANTSGAEPVMSKADLKALLNLSKRQPVSCAVGMSKDKQGVILLHRLTKPRKLLAELKRSAAASGMELDPATLRFGRAEVDGASDSTTVHFTVNKAAPAALRMKLVERLRPAGFQKCDLTVDAALEDEPEDAQAAGGQQGAGAHGAAGPGAPSGTSAAAGGAAAADADGPAAAGTAPPSGAAASAAADAVPANAAGSPAAAPGGADGAAGPLRTRLTGLVRRLAAALPAGPPGADDMRTAATAAHGALTAGDLAGAGRAADTLERLLGNSPASATAGAGAASAASAGPDAQPLPASAPGNTAPDAAAPTAAAPNAGAEGAGMERGSPDTADPAAARASPAAPRPGRPRHQPGSPVFAKGRDAWTAVRAKLSSDLDATLKALTARAKGDSSLVQDIEGMINPIMAQLDDSLARKLDEIAGGADAGSHARQVQEAEAILDRYRTFATGSKEVAHLDRNPVHPIALGRTLETALAALAKVVHTSDDVEPQRDAVPRAA